MIETTPVPRTGRLFWRRCALAVAGVALAVGASSLALQPRPAMAESGGIVICLEPVIVLIVGPPDHHGPPCPTPEPEETPTPTPKPPPPKPPPPPTPVPAPPTPVPTLAPTPPPTAPPSPVRRPPAPIALRLVAQPQPLPPPEAAPAPAPVPASPPAVRPPALVPGLNRSAPLLTSTPLALLLAVAVAVASMGGAAAHLVGRRGAGR
jgi:hypothetical protein